MNPLHPSIISFNGNDYNIKRRYVPISPTSYGSISPTFLDPNLYCGQNPNRNPNSLCYPSPPYRHPLSPTFLPSDDGGFRFNLHPNLSPRARDPMYLNPPRSYTPFVNQDFSLEKRIRIAPVNNNQPNFRSCSKNKQKGFLSRPHYEFRSSENSLSNGEALHKEGLISNSVFSDTSRDMKKERAIYEGDLRVVLEKGKRRKIVGDDRGKEKPSTNDVRKPSVLHRIQSPKALGKRETELFDSASSEVNAVNGEEGNRPIEVDMSFKSDTWIAKQILVDDHSESGFLKKKNKKKRKRKKMVANSGRKTYRIEERSFAPDRKTSHASVASVGWGVDGMISRSQNNHKLVQSDINRKEDCCSLLIPCDSTQSLESGEIACSMEVQLDGNLTQKFSQNETQCEESSTNLAVQTIFSEMRCESSVENLPNHINDSIQHSEIIEKRETVNQYTVKDHNNEIGKHDDSCEIGVDVHGSIEYSPLPGNTDLHNVKRDNHTDFTLEVNPLESTSVYEVHNSIVKQPLSIPPCPNGCIDNGISDDIKCEVSSALDVKNTVSASKAIHLKADNESVQNCATISMMVPVSPSQGPNQSKSPGIIQESTINKTNLKFGNPKFSPHQTTYTLRPMKRISTIGSVVRPRTWHRTNCMSVSLPSNMPGLNTPNSKRQSPKKLGKLQNTSYIRKGNSLVRKCEPVAKFSTVSASPGSSIKGSNLPNGDQIGDSICFSSKVTGISHTCGLKTGKSCSSCERSKSSQTHAGKMTSFAPSTSLVLCSEARPEIPEQAISHVSQSSESPDLFLIQNGLTQPLAAPSTEIGSSFIQNSETVTTKPSSSSNVQYYRRKKHQLIRNINSSVHSKKAVQMWDSHPIVPEELEHSSRKNHRNLFSATGEKEASKFSAVQMLGGMKSSSESRNSLQYQKVLPYLCPWKRVMFRYSATRFRAVSNRSLTLTRSLQLSLNRGTLYTTSKGGFTLRKSKVISVSRSNLKWSKSIEKRSRKINKNATLAVAAVEKKKRERKGYNPHIIRKSGKGIYRIGFVRYKMDSSRRTLQKISDKESLDSDHKSGKVNKSTFVPRRVFIGNDEYVRIGNGNKLVRDPKKRVRILANEKIRWSLHTVRLRAAKNQQYCQFFTRFGKCNKNDGKCPYIHDPSKVAVCTKYLMGRCSGSDCKLTHKVIPERMPDCSYFLQGMCANENCPYRHVNVNPSACVCEGFLRGYCADGDECCKKHSYVCPAFESSGVCSQGSLCKLHHPTEGSKSRKRKKAKALTKTGRRYFGSNPINVTESEKLSHDTAKVEIMEDVCAADGQFMEYISLDISDNDADDECIQINNQTSFHDEYCESFLDSDDQIKPVLLMNRTS